MRAMVWTLRKQSVLVETTRRVELWRERTLAAASQGSPLLRVEQDPANSLCSRAHNYLGGYCATAAMAAWARLRSALITAGGDYSPVRGATPDELLYKALYASPSSPRTPGNMDREKAEHDDEIETPNSSTRLVPKVGARRLGLARTYPR